MVAGMVSLLASIAVAGASETPPAFVSKLRELRPDVVRWETRPAALQAQATPESGVVALGRLAARMPVRFADGRVHWFIVAGFRPVPVSRGDLAAGQALAADAVDSAERDVIALDCAPVALDPSHHWRAKRRLSAGDALCANNVEPAPEVERDHEVTLSAGRSAVQVSRRLTAGHDARIGERVRLRDRDSGATLIAIVTGPAAARVPE
jgi:flagella basal body P-ring formation protein FlgA